MPALPVHYTGSYLTRQPGAGIPGAPSILQSLANPAPSATAAEKKDIDRAKAVGVVKTNAPALLDRTRNRDRIRDFYDSSSILRVQT
jgi:hypothetical protein